MQRTVWLALSYNVPINPSKARVYVWRKLREIGAEYFKQGVAVLPNSAQGMQQFSALAVKIRQMGGEASIVELRFTDPADEQEMAGRFKRQVEEEYTQLISDCADVLRMLKNPGQMLSQAQSDQIRKVVKRYRKTRSKDYFKASSSVNEVEAGINELIDTVRSVAADFGKQLRQLKEG